MKTEVLRPLLPGQLRKQRAFLKQMIAARIDALVDRGPFEAMAEIARVLPTMAISALVGLPEEGRARGCWTGPPRRSTPSARRLAEFASGFHAAARGPRVSSRARPATPCMPGSWAHALFDAHGCRAVERGGSEGRVERLRASRAWTRPSSPRGTCCTTWPCPRAVADACATIRR